MVVTVHNPVEGYELHAIFGYRNSIGSTLRYWGVNCVVTRFPNDPKEPNSDVVDSISGSDPEAIRESIENNFKNRGLSVSSMQFLKRSSSERGRVITLLRILGWGVPPSSSDPDPISDQKM